MFFYFDKDYLDSVCCNIELSTNYVFHLIDTLNNTELENILKQSTLKMKN